MKTCRQCRRASRNSGFTLVEVVVASAVMALVFVAVLAAVSTARRIQVETENRLACIHVARETLEALQNRGYDSSDFAPGQRQMGHNRGHWTISEVSGQRTKDVTVVVNWVDRQGQTRSVSLTSSYSRSLHR